MARLSLILIIVGAQLTFHSMSLAGIEGQPVDVYKYFDTDNLDLYNLLATIGSFVLAAGIVVSLVNAIFSIKGGSPRRARPLGRRDARVVRTLPTAAAQLRRRPRRPQRRAAPRHPRGGAAPRAWR